MKKTYTTFLVFTVGALLLQFGYATGSGSGQCTRHTGYGALNNNPNTCTNSCHGTKPVITDSTTAVDTTTTTGVYDLAFREKLNVYPSVTNGKLCIANTAATKDLMYGVYTLDGQLVASGILADYASVTYLDIKALAPARYIIRLANEAHSASYHIEKQ